MPIYLYQCDTCGLRFEQSQRMSDEPLTKCPECEGHLRRIIQPVGIIFKGSGFYVTDNRQASSSTLKPSKEGDKAEEAKPAAEPATEKPAPKAEEA